jgi:RNA polymerase sigma factor (sigma-70 family)
MLRLATLVRRMRADGPHAGLSACRQVGIPTGDSCSDADLLARFARSRDEAAFELLVWRHGAMVLSACRRVLHHDQDAEDAFQAVFLVLAKKSRTVARGSALPAWLHRVAVRIATRLAQSRRAIAPMAAAPVAPPEPDAVVREELCGIVDDEIDRLPERFRRAVVLCYLEGLSAAEAAERLGCPTGTVESRLANARKRLHAALTQRGVTLPATLAASSTLTPEVVARTTKTATAFARGEVVANESAVRMAKGVLVMGQARTWAAVVVLAALAATVTAGVGWSDSSAQQPPAPPRSADAPKPQQLNEPRANADEPPDPRLKKEWWGDPIDFGNGGRGLLKAISPDGKRAIVYHNLGMVCVDLAESKIVWYRDMKEVWPLHTVAYSPDGKLIATAEADNGANLYDAETGRPIELFAVTAKPHEWPYQAAFLPDGKLIVLFQGTRFQPEPGKPQPPAGTRPENNRLSFSLVVYDLATQKEVRRIHEEEARDEGDVHWRLVGRDLLMERRTVWYDKKPPRYQPTKQVLRYTDPLTGKTTPEIAVEKGDNNTMGLSPDGTTLIAMTPGETPRLLDRATGRVVARLEGHKRPVTDAVFSPDGKLIATVSGGTPEHYDTSDPAKKLPDGPAELMIRDATGAVMVRYQYTRTSYEFGKLDFSPNGKYLLVSTGWRDKLWAFGELPFPRPKAGEHVGIPTIPMPEARKPAPTATLPQPAVPPPASGGLVADALDKLAEDLPKSGRPMAQQVDALFLAALGRLPTAAELKKVNEQYRGRFTADVFRAILADLAKSPEFEAHIKTLGQRLAKPPAKQPGQDGLWPGSPFRPFGHGIGPFVPTEYGGGSKQ